MRPEIPEPLAGEIDDRVRSEVRVPPDRLTFADRLDILVEEYDERRDEAETLRDRVEELEATVEDLREKNRELQEFNNGVSVSGSNNW
jgi:polyhydroxyalkanoate synthesis regulator phasin